MLSEFPQGVVILDVNETNGKNAQKELQDKYGIGKVVFQKCDVTQKDQVKGKIFSIFIQKSHVHDLQISLRLEFCPC